MRKLHRKKYLAFLQISHIFRTGHQSYYFLWTIIGPELFAIIKFNLLTVFTIPFRSHTFFSILKLSRLSHNIDVNQQLFWSIMRVTVSTCYLNFFTWRPRCLNSVLSKSENSNLSYDAKNSKKLYALKKSRILAVSQGRIQSSTDWIWSVGPLTIQYRLGC